MFNCCLLITEWKNFFTSIAVSVLGNFYCLMYSLRSFKIFSILTACFFLEENPRRNPILRYKAVSGCNFGMEKISSISVLFFIVTNTLLSSKREDLDSIYVCIVSMKLPKLNLSPHGAVMP